MKNLIAFFEIPVTDFYRLVPYPMHLTSSPQSMAF